MRGMKTYRNPPDVHPPLAAYSHQVELSGPGRQLILSGQVGVAADGGVELPWSADRPGPFRDSAA